MVNYSVYHTIIVYTYIFNWTSKWVFFLFFLRSLTSVQHGHWLHPKASSTHEAVLFLSERATTLQSWGQSYHCKCIDALMVKKCRSIWVQNGVSESVESFLQKMLMRQFMLMKLQYQVPIYLSAKDMKNWLLAGRSFLEEWVHKDRLD